MISAFADLKSGFEKRNQTIARLARSAKADLALRYFDIKAATNREDAVWQMFQVELFNYTGMFASENKSRQIGASFTLSGDALCDGLIKGDHTVITTSFNLEEAKEKVVYVKKWWEARCMDPHNMPTREEFNERGEWIGEQGNRITEWPEVVKANALHFELSNGFRFISHPSKPPRGKRASFIGDEFAHIQHAQAVYTAALPMVTRGRGRNTVRIASTPLGASGAFYEIHSDERKYKSFKRFDHGWWEIFDLCLKENYHACRQSFYAGMDPEEMVRRFGTRGEAGMVMLFENADLEAFLQEFCLQFLDATHAFLSLALITSCHPAYYLTNLDPTESGDDYIEDQDPDYIERMIENSHIGFKAVASGGIREKSAEQIGKCLEAIRQLEAFIDHGVGRNLALAYDCGRTKDGAEITVYELAGGRYIQRLMITMRNIEFEHQRQVLKACFEDLPIKRGLFDKNGIGMDLHEWAENRWGPYKAEGSSFENQQKNEWAVTLKRSMEQRKVTIIPDKDQDAQLHSVQRKATLAGGRFQYVVAEQTSTVGGGQKITHHADKFWVNAMAVWLCEEMARGGVIPATTGEYQSPEMTRQLAAKGLLRKQAVARPNARVLSQRAMDKMSR